MSLQFIIGSSGSGKSCYAYQNIIEQAGLHPEKLFFVIVPEQFTMQTQKTLVEMSPGKGILNIDILSFEPVRAWCSRRWSSSMERSFPTWEARCVRRDIWMK